MFNHRFSLYYIVIGCVVLVIVCYIGFKSYQNHVEFKRFFSDAQAFSRSLDSQHDLMQKIDPHTPVGDNLHSHSGLLNRLSGESYPSANNPTVAPKTDPPSGREIHALFVDYVDTGIMTGQLEQYINDLQGNNPYRKKVIQRIVSRHGQIHTVLVPEGHEYQEGDTILQSELDPPTQVFSFGGEKMSYIVDGVEYEAHEYHKIADPYEREEYFNKFVWSIENGVSMEVVEQKVAKGELDFTLSAEQKWYVDQSEERTRRAQWLSDQFAKPLPPNRAPVKVKILSDEPEDALPGWMRKLQRNPKPASGEAPDASPIPDAWLPFDTSPVHIDSPLVPSARPDISESALTRPRDAEREASNNTPPPPTTESLRDELSLDPFDKAKQFIDQYGTAEGLRRLRESDPEAALQFERERLRSGSPQPSESSRDASDGAESER